MFKNILSDKSGNFELYLAQPIYKYIKVCGNSYIKNTITGENVGQELRLIEYRFDINGNIIENPVKEEDCYEVRELEF